MAAIKTKRFRRPNHWTLAQLIAHHTAPPNENGCTLWTGLLAANGYGRVTWKGTFQKAHRPAWIVAKGPIPAGMKVLHKCDVRACVNVAHLFLGTQAENLDDMRAKGRGICGELTWNAKLTAAQVIAIRADNRPNQTIADEYGVRNPQVSRIKNRLRWKHI